MSSIETGCFRPMLRSGRGQRGRRVVLPGATAALTSASTVLTDWLLQLTVGKGLAKGDPGGISDRPVGRQWRGHSAS